MRSASNADRRPFQFSLRTLLLLFVASAVVIVLVNPRVITGHFCYVTIDELDIKPDGGFSVKYSKTHSPGTKVALVRPGGGASGAISGGAFVWFCRSTAASSGRVPLARLGLDEKDSFQAINVKQGQTYRIELDGRLPLYQLPDSVADRSYDAYIEFTKYP